MQCLDPAAEHLGRLGDLLDRRHLDATLLEVRSRAAGRDELQPSLASPLRKLGDAVLVVDGDQRARHRSPTTSGSSRC